MGQQSSLAKLTFRRAHPADAAEMAPLVFASGHEEFQFLLGASPAECVDFLRLAISQSRGRFSWQRHRIAILNDRPVAILALLDGYSSFLDSLHLATLLVKHFGWYRTGSILRRGLILEQEIPAPRLRQTLVAHCATRADLRGKGIFSALFQDTLTGGFLPMRKGQEIVLDVLDSNPRAAALYSKLGFTDMTRHSPPNKGLPFSLYSTRLRFAGTPIYIQPKYLSCRHAK